jgi:hypothetical protein
MLAGAALIALSVPSLAQITNPSQPGTATPPAAQIPPAMPAQPSTPNAQPAPTTPPAARPATPVAPAAQQGEPARMAGSHLIGLTLRNTANESIGEIDDVIVDRDGRVREVIVGVGGFLGIGEHKVAIAWDQLRFDANRDVAMVNMTKEQLQAMPEYRADRLRNNTAPAAGTTPPAAAPAPRANPPASTPPASGGTPPARN